MSALTPEQLSIVHHQQGHARVIAVAGAGYFFTQKPDAPTAPAQIMALDF